MSARLTSGILHTGKLHPVWCAFSRNTEFKLSDSANFFARADCAHEEGFKPLKKIHPRMYLPNQVETYLQVVSQSYDSSQYHLQRAPSGHT